MHRTKIFIVSLTAVLSGIGAVCAANTYYVSPNGSDTAAGGIGTPFKTIQKAANLVQPGDTVVIYGGMYRETVIPARSGTSSKPITFMANASDVVTINGCDPVTGWTLQRTGNTYVAPIKSNLGQDKNQLFVDYQLYHPASYPPTGMDPIRPGLATAAAGSTSTMIIDPNLTQPAGYWTGARIWFLGGNQAWEPWIATTGVVKSSAPGVLNIQSDPGSETASDYTAGPGTKYFLTGGGLTAPTNPGEWTIAKTGTQVYLCTPADVSPATHIVEMKARQIGFNLQSKSYIKVQRINFFATTLNMAYANYCSADYCNFTYVSHFNNMSSKGGWDTRDDSGVVLSGTGSTLSNSVIKYSAGNGVTVLGSNNTVSNCLISGSDYIGGDSAGIRVTGTKHTIINNTVFECGRSGIVHRSLTNSVISGNDISFFGMLTKDAGGTYTFGTNGSGTVVSYNWIHDAQDSVLTGIHSLSGVYLDNDSSNHVVHHNVTWNVEGGICVNSPSAGNLVANNDFVSKGRGDSVGGDLSNLTSQFFNNVLSTTVDSSATGTWTANVANQNPNFAAPLLNNFGLLQSSPAYGRGTIVPNITPSTSPDAGAYQTGSSLWVPGSSLAPQAPCGLTANPLPTGVQLNWLPSSGATSYNVYVRSSGQPGFSFLATVSGTGYFAALPVAGSNYEFVVTASIRNEGPHSASVYANPTLAAKLYPSSGGALVGGLTTYSDTAATNGLYVSRFSAGSFITFRGVDGGAGGASTLSFKFANGTSTRTLYLSVNGGSPVAVSFPWTKGYGGSGNAAVYGTVKTQVLLNPGKVNTLQLSSQAAGQTIDLDSIQVS